MSEVAMRSGLVALIQELETEGVLTETSLDLSHTILDYQTCESLAAFFGQVNHASRWWIGDLLLYVEMAHGELVSQAAEATKLAPQTIENIMSISRRVPRSRRTHQLSFSAHAEVAALEPPDQERWLQTCEAERLTTMELRARIRAERNGTPDITGPDPVCRCCGRPLAG